MHRGDVVIRDTLHGSSELVLVWSVRRNTSVYVAGCNMRVPDEDTCHSQLRKAEVYAQLLDR